MHTNNIELASVYRLSATSFRNSAEILERQFKEKREGMPFNIRSMPFYYLLSHACELLLKSALLKRDFSPEQLRQYSVRHNLVGLANALSAKDIKLSERNMVVLRGLSRQHQSHDLRYTALLDDGKPTYTPEPKDVYDLLDELLMATRT